MLRKYPIASFFIITYALTWASVGFLFARGEDILLGIGAFAPAIAALIVTAATEGLSGIKALISRLFLWRVHLKWYLIALLAPTLMELLAVLTQKLLGDRTTAIAFPDLLQLLLKQLPALAIVLLFLIFSAAGEELGWRGFALPGLERRFGSLGASLILGLLWGCWHIPLFYVPGSLQNGLPIPGYILATIGYSFIYTCLYNGTKGSLLLCCLYHAASNLTLLYGNALFPKVISNLYLSLPALAVLVGIVMLISGPGSFIADNRC